MHERNPWVDRELFVLNQLRGGRILNYFSIWKYNEKNF
jgi:hypothetical protein